MTLSAVCSNPGRTVFLGDIENLAYNSNKDSLLSEDVQRTSVAVWSIIGLYNPQEIIASSHHFAQWIWFSWGRNPRRLIGSGRNGADHELLEVIYSENLHTRYDTVIIGSGDGIFAQPAAQLSKEGLKVIAIHGKGRLSNKLKLAVHESIQIKTHQTEKSIA